MNNRFSSENFEKQAELISAGLQKIRQDAYDDGFQKGIAEGKLQALSLLEKLQNNCNDESELGIAAAIKEIEKSFK